MFNKFKAYFFHDVNKLLEDFDVVINKLHAATFFHKAQADAARVTAALHEGHAVRAAAAASKLEALVQ